MTREGGVVELVSAHEADKIENRWAAPVRKAQPLTVPALEHAKTKLFVAVRGTKYVWVAEDENFVPLKFFLVSPPTPSQQGDCMVVRECSSFGRC